MPKIKTHKTAQKRFKISGSGKILRSKGAKSHLRRKRSRRCLQALDKSIVVTNAAESKRVKTLCPYLKP